MYGKNGLVKFSNLYNQIERDITVKELKKHTQRERERGRGREGSRQKGCLGKAVSSIQCMIGAWK